MKRNLLLVLALFTVLCVRANAEVTPPQMTDPEYMINGGYSEAAAEEVFKIKNRVDGKPCEPLYNKTNKSKYVNFFRKCYEYIDPAQDSSERYHHDTKQSPSWSDL